MRLRLKLLHLQIILDHNKFKMWIVNVILLATFTCTMVHAITDEQIKIEFLKQVMKCTKTNPVEMSDLMQLQQLIVPTKTEVKCLLACAYKADGMMNDKGLYDSEQGYKKAELYKNGDEKRLTNAKKLIDICVKVNDVDVSDGEKGCERAGLILKCILDNAPKLGFKV